MQKNTNFFCFLPFDPNALPISLADVEHGMQKNACHMVTLVLAAWTRALSIVDAVFSQSQLYQNAIHFLYILYTSSQHSTCFYYDSRL